MALAIGECRIYWIQLRSMPMDCLLQAAFPVFLEQALFLATSLLNLEKIGNVPHARGMN